MRFEKDDEDYGWLANISSVAWDDDLPTKKDNCPISYESVEEDQECRDNWDFNE